MADRDLGALLEPHKKTLESISQSLAAGDQAKTAGSLATLVAALATGHPEIAILAPFAQSAVARAFGNSADAMLRRELDTMVADEAKAAFAAQIAEPIEALIGQALIQLVRVQHNVKDELLKALGGVREELSTFREQFKAESGAQPFAVTVDEQIVKGGIGVRVRPETTKRVFIRRQEITAGVGIELD